MIALLALSACVIHVSGDLMRRDQWPIPLRLGVSLAVCAIPTFLTPPGARHVTASVFYAFWLGSVLVRFGPLFGLGGWKPEILGLLLLTPCFFVLWRRRTRSRGAGPG